MLVMKSTVPVGTGEKVRAALDARGLAHVGYVSNPEFLAEGSAVRDFMEPDRVVVGAFTEADATTVAGALRRRSTRRSCDADVASAEMIKLAANAFLMTRISFINEIANVCEATGADVVKVAEGVGLDHRLGPHFLRAGIGWGGSLLPEGRVALKQLASNSGYHFQLLSAVIEVNELQKRRVIGKLEKHLGKLRGKTIALLGLAFKPNTDDMREAPSLVLASRLLAEGAEVRAWDPVADARRLLQGVDLLRQRARRGRRRRRGRDRDRVGRAARARLRRGAAGDDAAADRRRPQPARPRGRPAAAGFAYEGIGRAASPLAALPETEEPERADRSRSGSDHPGRREGRAPRRGRGRPAEGARRGRRPAARRLPGRAARARRASTRVIVSCAAGAGRRVRDGARRARRRDRGRRRSPSRWGGAEASASRPRRGASRATCSR